MLKHTKRQMSIFMDIDLDLDMNDKGDDGSEITSLTCGSRTSDSCAAGSSSSSSSSSGSGRDANGDSGSAGATTAYPAARDNVGSHSTT